MPSFDVVSEVNMQEVTNAVAQTQKEIDTRYDFKGIETLIELVESALTVRTASDQKLEAVREILRAKLMKRSVPVDNLDYGKVEAATGRSVRQVITIKQGIEVDKAKEIVKFIKDTKMKVQASIQGDVVRVTGKNRDDLQECIQQLKAKDFSLSLQFKNFRD
jgi:cyclic-di-GMP-binding protein